MRYIYEPIRYNFSRRKGATIKYLVIHDTGNDSKGADAMSHYRYFNGGNRNASAHYFVDDERVVQLVGDSFSAWHVGDGRGRYGITNANSLGIEMCINSDGNYAKMYYHTVELAKNIMQKFNIPIERVVRHYDASRKLCPNHMRKSGWQAWAQFKKDIQAPIKLKIDLSKSSTAIPVDQEAEIARREAEVKNDPTKKYHYEKAEASMREIEKKFELYEEQAKDMTPSAWAKEEWEEAIKLGITDGSYPKRYTTREETAAMIMRAIKEAKNGKCNCTDGGGVGYRTGL